MKQTLKKLLVTALASKPISRIASSFVNHGVPIFMLHRMQMPAHAYTGASEQHLRNCLLYLKDKGYRFASLEELILCIRSGETLPTKTAVFTLDDGFIDQASIAVPIFHEFGCPLTFFVISGLLDQELWPWDDKVSWIIENTPLQQLNFTVEDEVFSLQLGSATAKREARHRIRDVFKEFSANRIDEYIAQIAEECGTVIPESIPESYQPITWDIARKLESQGVQFAPHTRSHRILSKLDRKSAEKEISDCWHTLNRELTNPLNIFCYPTGRVLDFGPREIDILKEMGFLGAVSTEPGYVMNNTKGENYLFKLPRIELPGNMTEFIQYCSWIEHARKAG